MHANRDTGFANANDVHTAPSSRRFHGEPPLHAPFQVTGRPQNQLQARGVRPALARLTLNHLLPVIVRHAAQALHAPLGRAAATAIAARGGGAVAATGNGIHQDTDNVVATVAPPLGSRSRIYRRPSARRSALRTVGCWQCGTPAAPLPGRGRCGAGGRARRGPPALLCRLRRCRIVAVFVAIVFS